VTAPPQQWHRLSTAASNHLERLLRSTSFVTVDDGTTGPVTILVDEVGMDRKPSVIHSLSVSDVLKYWAQLTPEQKAAHLATQFANLDDPPALQALRLQALQTHHSLFDRFAGTFHAFHCLEARVEELLAEDNRRQASARFFGRQIDCLPYLLERIGQTSTTTPVAGVAAVEAPLDDDRDDIDRRHGCAGRGGPRDLCARHPVPHVGRPRPDAGDGGLSQGRADAGRGTGLRHHDARSWRGALDDRSRARP
jgi:hypothetical protein